MNTEIYLDKFENALKAFDKKVLENSGLEIQTGIWLNSVVLRLQKKHWANNPDEKPHSGSAIFMGIWIDQEAFSKKIIKYNIHALKLRQLNGYALQSRVFADSFREKFKEFEQKWENASVQFGPQTLMEGWIPLNDEKIHEDILNLINSFIEIVPLIDETLLEFQEKAKS
ncbi:hypothetical protein [Chryseobacterium schmidteae]|uniref:hypothetical protein n=1 Tax=Chryseobacterium schmidteae TaxID=2730404 RepID=UPI00158EFB7A|nr:hypothetical protein [Chryseobacterium schmidteae]